MNRICRREPIYEALSVLPPRIQERVRCDFVTGSDAVFIGLHGFEDTGDGRSYRCTAHCSYEHHTHDKSLTVVLPTNETPITIVHELGHVLDANIGWDRHTPDPVSNYAKTNSYEAFAEAFALWIAPEWSLDFDPSVRLDVLEQDKKTLGLFEELARS